MTGDDWIHFAIAIVAFLIGLTVGAKWLAPEDGQYVPLPVKMINAIGNGFHFYYRLIFFGAALYAVYYLVVDLTHPNPAPLAPRSQSLVPPTK